MAYGWKGTVAEFLSDCSSLPHALAEAHGKYYIDLPGMSQRTAWDHQAEILCATFRGVPRAKDWGLIVEYELPFEGGRRVDKVALAAQNVLALEFKDSALIKRADLDQVRAYARDLAEYHSECRNKAVHPILVLANARSLRTDVDGTAVVAPDDLPFVLDELGGRGYATDVEAWLRGTYAPLPSLVEAARRVFRDEPLPALRRAAGARIPELLAWLRDLVARAERNSERHLVLLTGVPGAGKTLVGLQFVHDLGSEGEAPAIFLSGNGPLVELLQYLLQSKTFVRPVRQFVLEYGIRKLALPSHHVVVFDEAQRAWDEIRVNEKHRIEKSEPAIFADIASRIPGWAVLVGLIGEGQEIYLGEEAGVEQWLHALAGASERFSVHVPPHLESLFSGRTVSGRFGVNVEPLLQLVVSMRTHSAGYAHEWVNALINSDIERARALSVELKPKGYDVYVTSDLFEAKAYLRSRYADAPEKRYGLLASSKALNLPALGIDSSYFATQRVQVGPWFSAPPDDPQSCCRLDRPVTEFQCQGLELDLPIVCWGDDLRWEANKHWVASRRTRGARSSEQLRLNSYRVLLTRGRDGTIVFIPPNLRSDQSSVVSDVLLRAGAKRLEEAVYA